MSPVVEELKTRLGQLPIADRVELASFLLKSLDDGIADEADSSWNAELDALYQQIVDGTVAGVPAQTALAQLRY
jgi:hypothetical protein